MHSPPPSISLRAAALLFSFHQPSNSAGRGNGHTGISGRLSRIQTGNLSSDIQARLHNQDISAISLSYPAALSQKVFKHQAYPVRAAKRHVVDAPYSNPIAEAARGNLTGSMQLAKLSAYRTHAAIQRLGDFLAGQIRIELEKLQHCDFTAILRFLRFRCFHGKIPKSKLLRVVATASLPASPTIQIDRLLSRFCCTTHDCDEHALPCCACSRGCIRVFLSTVEPR